MTLQSLVNRLGVPSSTAIVEDWERYMGIEHNDKKSFEMRWQQMMNDKKEYYVI